MNQTNPEDGENTHLESEENELVESQSADGENEPQA